MAIQTIDLGSVRGLEGLKGDAGDSAYAIAVQQGYEGSEAEWLASLKGDSGHTPTSAEIREAFGSLTTQNISATATVTVAANTMHRINVVAPAADESSAEENEQEDSPTVILSLDETNTWTPGDYAFVQIEGASSDIKPTVSVVATSPIECIPEPTNLGSQRTAVYVVWMGQAFLVSIRTLEG